MLPAKFELFFAHFDVLLLLFSPRFFRSVGLFSGNQPKVVERAEPSKAQKGGAGTGTGSGLELDIYATPSTTWTKTRRAEEEEQQQQQQQQATCDSTRQDEAAVKY